MAKTYYIANQRTRDRFTAPPMFEGSAETFNFNYKSWAQDNGTVTGVTITVEYGDAAVSGEALTSNVKTFVVTTANTGKSLIKLAATDGTDIDVQWLEINAKPVGLSDDYGMVSV